MKITSLALYLMNLIKQTEKTLFDRSIRMVVPEIPGLIACPLFDCFKKICEPIRAVAWGDHLLYGCWSAMSNNVIDLPINRFQIFLRKHQFAFGG